MLSLGGLSLFAESEGYSSAVACGLLITVASLVAGHRLSVPGLSSCDPRALEHTLGSCSVQA